MEAEEAEQQLEIRDPAEVAHQILAITDLPVLRKVLDQLIPLLLHRVEVAAPAEQVEAAAAAEVALAVAAADQLEGAADNISN